MYQQFEIEYTERAVVDVPKEFDLRRKDLYSFNFYCDEFTIKCKKTGNVLYQETFSVDSSCSPSCITLYKRDDKHLDKMIMTWGEDEPGDTWYDDGDDEDSDDEDLDDKLKNLEELLKNKNK